MSARQESPREAREIEFATVVGPTFAPALIDVAAELTRRHPTYSTDQIREMIVVRGVNGFIDDLNLPRADSNRDEDA